MTKRLTNEEITQIRERVEYAKADGIGVGMIVFRDVPKLMAEIDRLRAENDRLCPIGDLDTITTLRTEIEYRDDIIADKDGEIERYRKARKEIESLWDGEYVRNANEYQGGYLDGLDRAIGIIDEALEEESE